mmetsp:Transcript_60015/g.127111  ORF Transcript_60015/g.127111 Transcript_60015/m.127111 type:complete len:202 (-) Transcript_60015:2257-2862(-)
MPPEPSEMEANQPNPEKDVDPSLSRFKAAPAPSAPPLPSQRRPREPLRPARTWTQKGVAHSRNPQCSLKVAMENFLQHLRSSPPTCPPTRLRHMAALVATPPTRPPAAYSRSPSICSTPMAGASTRVRRRTQMRSPNQSMLIPRRLMLSLWPNQRCRRILLTRRVEPCLMTSHLPRSRRHRLFRQWMISTQRVDLSHHQCQ